MTSTKLCPYCGAPVTSSRRKPDDYCCPEHKELDARLLAAPAIQIQPVDILDPTVTILTPKQKRGLSGAKRRIPGCCQDLTEIRELRRQELKRHPKALQRAVLEIYKYYNLI